MAAAPRPPISAAFGIAPEKTVVWRNFPPAHVWTFTAQEQPAAQPAPAQGAASWTRPDQALFRISPPTP